MMVTRLIALCFLLGLPLSAEAANQESKSGLTWQRNLAEARKVAKRDGRILLIFVCQPHSMWDKVMERDTLMDKKVVRVLKEGFVVVRLFGDNEPDLVRKYDLG